MAQEINTIQETTSTEEKIVRFLQKADTADNWRTNNPVLLAKEVGYEIDTGKYKIGKDGITPWNDLEYPDFCEVSLQDLANIKTELSNNITDNTNEIEELCDKVDTNTVNIGLAQEEIQALKDRGISLEGNIVTTTLHMGGENCKFGIIANATDSDGNGKKNYQIFANEYDTNATTDEDIINSFMVGGHYKLQAIIRKNDGQNVTYETIIVPLVVINKVINSAEYPTHYIVCEVADNEDKITEIPTGDADSKYEITYVSDNAVSFGYGNELYAYNSFTTGLDNEITNTGEQSVAFGQSNKISGRNKIVSGTGLLSTNTHEGAAVFGQYNEDIKDALFIVGNGDDEDSPSNAHTLDNNGNAWFAGNIYLGGDGQDNAEINLKEKLNEIGSYKPESIIYTFKGSANNASQLPIIGYEIIPISNDIQMGNMKVGEYDPDSREITIYDEHIGGQYDSYAITIPIEPITLPKGEYAITDNYFNFNSSCPPWEYIVTYKGNAYLVEDTVTITSIVYGDSNAGHSLPSGTTIPKYIDLVQFNDKDEKYDVIPVDSTLVPGNVYNVLDTGMNYAWTGTEWDALGGSSNSPGQPGLGNNSVTFASSTNTFNENKLPMLRNIYYKPIVGELSNIELKTNRVFSSGNLAVIHSATKHEITSDGYTGFFPSEKLRVGDICLVEVSDDNNPQIKYTGKIQLTEIVDNQIENGEEKPYGYIKFDYITEPPQYNFEIHGTGNCSLTALIEATDFENLTFTTDKNDTKLEKLYKYTDTWGNVRYTVFEDYTPNIADGKTPTSNGTIIPASPIEKVEDDTDPMYKAIRYEALLDPETQFSVSAGKNSITTGENAVAVGEESIAMGDFTVALGRHNAAIGRQILTRGYNAVGLGYGSTVTGINAVALNEAGKALGYGSLTVGDHCTAGGAYAIAGGYQSIATKQGAIAVGHLSRATARHATAIGQVTEANGNYCVVTGNQNKCSGIASIVGGYGNNVTGDHSFTIGASNQVDGGYNIVGGNNNTITSIDGLVVGADNTVHGNYNSVFGHQNTIKNIDENKLTISVLCTGANNTASGEVHSVNGQDNTVQGKAHMVSGTNNKITIDAAITGEPTKTYDQLYNSFVTGSNNRLSGSRSLIAGHGNKSQFDYTNLLGSQLTAGCKYQTVLGKVNAIRNDALLVVGCGNWDDGTKQKNALVITNTGKAEITSDIELIDANAGIILKSPNGTKYKLTVNDDGALVTEKI